MKTHLPEIKSTLKAMLSRHMPPLQITKEKPEVFETSGTKPVMQGRQKVDGHYFASIVPKSKDIRLYFFPIYTHPSEYEGFSGEFRKCLKGKSCFHIKKLSAGLEAEFDQAITHGVKIYQRDGLI